MGAFRQNAAVFHIQNPVGMDDCGKAVRDQNHGPVFGNPVDGLLNLRLRYVVQGGSGFVKQNNPIVFQQASGNRKVF